MTSSFSCQFPQMTTIANTHQMVHRYTPKPVPFAIHTHTPAPSPPHYLDGSTCPLVQCQGLVDKRVWDVKNSALFADRDGMKSGVRGFHGLAGFGMPCTIGYDTCSLKMSFYNDHHICEQVLTTARQGEMDRCLQDWEAGWGVLEDSTVLQASSGKEVYLFDSPSLVASPWCHWSITFSPNKIEHNIINYIHQEATKQD